MMERIRVGICLDDGHFAHALSMGLARACRSMTFSLIGNMDDCSGLDLILCTEETDDPRVVVMVRDEEQVNLCGDPPYRVYRYKESDHLINDLLFIYFRLTGKNLEFIGDARCKMLVFASISGGNGCTMTALSVGQMLYKLYGCKCLYLNLCPIDDSKKYLPEVSSNSLRHLLYYLNAEKDFPLGTFITQTSLVDFLHTNLINTYFDEVSLTLLNRLLKKVDEIGVYDFLILDVSNHLSRNNKQLLAQAYRTILLYQQRNQVLSGYFSSMLAEFRRLTGDNQLILVKNFVEDVEEDNRDEDASELFLSREDTAKTTNSEGLMDLSLLGQFQYDIGAIARKIMEEEGYA